MMRSGPLTRWPRYSLILAATVLSSLLGTWAALADREKLAANLSGLDAGPNILFIVDTSGSMADQVLSVEPYDPAITYAGPYTDAERLYYVLADSSGNFTYPDADYAQHGTYVNRPAFACESANGLLASAGFAADGFAQFDPTAGVERWRFLIAVDRYTECLSDDGVHGLTAFSTAVYPVNGSLDTQQPIPWTDDPDHIERHLWSGQSLSYVFFDNNYLNWLLTYDSDGNPIVRTRLELVQEALVDLVGRMLSAADDPPLSFNVGLMRFSTNGEGGMVLHHVDDVTVSPSALVAAIDSLLASDGTPLSETMFEASQYMSGSWVIFGLDSEPVASIAQSHVNGVYSSPIAAACQDNTIVLISDGQPTSDTSADNLIEAHIGASCEGNCLDDLALFLNRTDNAPAIDGMQTVQTFTVSLGADLDILHSATTAVVEFDENGYLLDPPHLGNFVVNDAGELQNAFDSIFDHLSASRSCIDSDDDGVSDSRDNCTLAANPAQRDSNGDGFGNVCDADLNNDGIVNVGDLAMLRLAFFSANADADLDGDGVVNVADLGRMRNQFFSPPGPSAGAP